MKSFFRFIGIIVSVFAAVFGALAVFDRFLKNGYYVCKSDENDE